MATRIIRKKTDSYSGFFEWLKLNWLIVCAVLLVFPVFYRWVTTLFAQVKAGQLKADTIVSNAQNGKSSPNIITQKSFNIFKKYPKVSPTEMERYKAVSQQVAIALGTNVEDNHYILNTDLFNVSAWSEDENKVISLLKTVPTTFPIVEDLYYNVFTRSRNLKTDLYKYLSVSEIAQLKKVFAKYGKKWL